MVPTNTASFPDTPIYKKAQDIFMLSRNISTYLVDDLATIDKQGMEDTNVYFSGDIVQQSVCLAPEILKAESASFFEDKQKRAATISRLTHLLNINCDRLEQANSNGKEFVHLLRQEVKKFKSLQRIWMLTL